MSRYTEHQLLTQMTDFTNCPKGIKNKPNTNEKWVYIYPVPIYSKDNNHPDYRFGKVSFFMEYSNKWMAVTVRQIFLKDWVPNDMLSVFKSKESTVSKIVNWFEWSTETKADISQDPKIIKKGVLGKVLKELDSTMVLIEVDKSFIKNSEFQNEGFWTQIANTSH